MWARRTRRPGRMEPPAATFPYAYEHVFDDRAGQPNTRFKRALRPATPGSPRNAAREPKTVDLAVALELVLLCRDAPERADRPVSSSV